MHSARYWWIALGLSLLASSRALAAPSLALAPLKLDSPLAPEWAKGDPNAAGPEASRRRWHLGLELGANIYGQGSWGQFEANVSLLGSYELSRHFELEGLASLIVGVEGGGYAIAVRPLYLLGDHLAFGGIAGLAPGLGQTGFGYVGAHAELRAGVFTLAYEPIYLSSAHALDNEAESGGAILPVRFLLGIHW